ncbi:dynamin family protein [Prosthecochloris sp. SCSIO W1101]|uniref:dynamin family protein n=1 Tax=Prosthecochloris sp. SCSIO W1101 TaxID=2992242 RepID=UPI00223E4D12|nr:dynamin family protein [Prosthecochloris sp. SCSIO W1101]UZJ40276.1 dynamin family protein [Prosthecochloris sp. SCSIO W1101]
MDKKPTIGIIGCFQNGKSTLVNCLLDDRVAMTGSGRATTSISTYYAWGEVQEVKWVCATTETRHSVPFHDYLQSNNLQIQGLSCFEVNLWKPLLQNVNIVDTPGFDNNEEDNEVAERSLAGMDFVIFVARNKGLSQNEMQLLNSLVKRKTPFAMLLNCKEVAKGLWEPLSAANENICQSIQSALKSAGQAPYPVHGKYVWPVNLAWFWYATQHMHDDGLNESEKDLFDDVQRFMKKHFNLSSFDYATLAVKSNFLPFRRTIQRIAAHFAFQNSEVGRQSKRYIEKSLNLLGANKKNEAMIHAERACYIAPGFIPALHNRANICLERDEYEEVIESATRVLRIDARDVDTLFLMSKAYFKKNNYKKANEDLTQIAKLLESEWHIAWEESDKVNQANKLIEAYLMKMECEQREGNAASALKALRYILESEYCPLDDIDDIEIKLLIYGLSAALEYKIKNINCCINSAKIALHILSALDDVPEIERLSGLCDLFKIKYESVPLHGTAQNLMVDLLRILWKACLIKYGLSNIQPAVTEFTESMNVFVPKSVWMDEPEFVPYFISYMGSREESIDVARYVDEYFEYTQDEMLALFVSKASKHLKGGNKIAFHEAVRLKCNVYVYKSFMKNAIELENIGVPILSCLKIDFTYKANEISMNYSLLYDDCIVKYSKVRWEGVFEGKSVLGTDWFGANKITDVKVDSVRCKQGVVEVINFEIR